ncbi:MAG: RluA family pseudouridine synthase [Gammaproteobacteria bacterium]|nr:RluA family pseudouridine synthase [Gammaproteobacteria bacterium]MDH5734548.1 RluA family pseudouridine synthase [Gammaproteobacteria bacterium]
MQYTQALVISPAMSDEAKKAYFIEAGASHAGQRLDNFLLNQLKGVPKSHIYRILRSGEVRVNKGRKKPNYRLEATDQIRIPPVRVSDKQEIGIPDAVLGKLEQTILFEDPHVLVINKPAGLAVHSGSGIQYGVIEILRKLRPEADMLELVHRLDRDTSGCLVIAKSRPALMQLHEQFRSDEGMKKHYRAILAGRWAGGEKLIDAPLIKNTLKGGERMVTVDEAGKEARSLFTPIEYYANATHMEIRLFTGRTHQIRVHAAHAGFPVAGDPKYGNTEFNQQLKSKGYKRMYLHAHTLGFKLDREYNITAPLDNEWQELLKILSLQS